MPDLENFPDDDEVALLLYIEEFTEQYQTELGQYGENEDTRQLGIEFMNNVISAANALGVQDFSSWHIPEWDDAYEAVNKFKLFVKAYVIRSQVKRARSAKVYSVSLDAPTRGRIHALINGIRELLERAAIDDRKRNSLYAKLNSFEADVDRNRTRFDNAMAFIIDAADTAKKVGESLNPLNELLKRINELLGHAKNLEGDVKLPPPLQHKQIEGPKKKEASGFSRDLDDEILF